MNNKRLVALLLLACTLLTTPFFMEVASAKTATDKKNEAESELDDVNSEIDDIRDSQNEVKDKIAEQRKKLNKLLADQKKLAGEIKTTEESIDKTQQDLERAQADEARQYDAMVIRIQYMYENSAEDSIWEALMQAKGLSDLLNRVEYVAQVHNTDRKLMAQYQATVDNVQMQKDMLLAQMELLLGQEEAYLGQQAEVEAVIADLKDDQAHYASQMKEAQQMATSLKKTIQEQERIIEEERRKREEEERRKQEEEKKKQEEELAKNTTGGKIVAYARQFVGNPYVWGGNSLTKGTDCSGFVHLVYKHFGFNLPRYSMSFLNVGTPVKREDIQPGDIVVYHKKNGIGHVGIYIGNGKIVEAQSTKTGITDTRSVDNRSIAGIRRIVKNP